MKTNVSRGFMLVAGLAALPATLSRAEYFCPPPDPRLSSLQQFFSKGNCPAEEYSEQFLQIADEFELDWRLLPSISLVETGGGREARNNNLFGWKNGRADFPSIDEGIRTVAATLATSKLYKHKSLDQKLRLYNGFDHYPVAVKSVMKRIHPTEQVRTYHAAAPFIRAAAR